MTNTNRRNRRATTRGPVKDNAIYAIVLMVEGFARAYGPAQFYRRLLVEGGSYTGLASEVRS